MNNQRHVDKMDGWSYIVSTNNGGSETNDGICITSMSDRDCGDKMDGRSWD